jgi:hypothetical protein
VTRSLRVSHGARTQASRGLRLSKCHCASDGPDSETRDPAALPGGPLQAKCRRDLRLQLECCRLNSSVNAFLNSCARRPPGPPRHSGGWGALAAPGQPGPGSGRAAAGGTDPPALATRRPWQTPAGVPKVPSTPETHAQNHDSQSDSDGLRVHLQAAILPPTASSSEGRRRASPRPGP